MKWNWLKNDKNLNVGHKYVFTKKKLCVCVYVCSSVSASHEWDVIKEEKKMFIVVTADKRQTTKKEAHIFLRLGL